MIWKRIAGNNEEICPFRRWSQAAGRLQGGNAIGGSLEMNQHLILVGAETLDFFDVSIRGMGTPKRCGHEQRQRQQTSATVHLYNIRDVRLGGKFPVFEDIIAIAIGWFRVA